MNTKAIYTIRENMEDSHFYTEFAGGCSFPFAVAENLNTANEAICSLCGFQQVSTAKLMRLITGDDNRLPLDAHGERLFGFRQCFQEYAQQMYGEATFKIGW